MDQNRNWTDEGAQLNSFPDVVRLTFRGETQQGGNIPMWTIDLAPEDAAKLSARLLNEANAAEKLREEKANEKRAERPDYYAGAEAERSAIIESLKLNTRLDPAHFEFVAKCIRCLPIPFPEEETPINYFSDETIRRCRDRIREAYYRGQRDMQARLSVDLDKASSNAVTDGYERAMRRAAEMAHEMKPEELTDEQAQALYPFVRHTSASSPPPVRPEIAENLPPANVAPMPTLSEAYVAGQKHMRMRNLQSLTGLAEMTPKVNENELVLRCRNLIAANGLMLLHDDKLPEPPYDLPPANVVAIETLLKNTEAAILKRREELQEVFMLGQMRAEAKALEILDIHIDNAADAMYLQEELSRTRNDIQGLDYDTEVDLQTRIITIP
jgi:hypothetical protein